MCQKVGIARACSVSGYEQKGARYVLIENTNECVEGLCLKDIL